MLILMFHSLLSFFLKDILNLAMCVIANFDNEEFFEIHDLESKESLLLKVSLCAMV